MPFSIHVTKDYLVFSAAHFITFGNNVCERLHGHNYHVEVELCGELGENQYVVDFIVVRDLLKKIVDRLDHRVILPDSHPTIAVHKDADEVIATFEDRRWVFPAEDCVILPVANTTTELLARYIGQCFLSELPSDHALTVKEIQVGVDENNGQWGRWRTEKN